MSMSSINRRQCSLATAVSLVLLAARVGAQEAPAQDAGEKLEEVIVTGSFIEGTPRDTALPVSIISRVDMENMGMPSNVEMLRTMPEMGSVQGESNRFNGLPPGAQSVNLRNLRSSRTVALLNGRRLPPQPGSVIGGFQNLNVVPTGALERIETLKDGGAAVYGADAVGGVVNYITLKSFDGLKTEASYTYIDDSDGSYNATVTWGTPLGERANFLLNLDYNHRSELLVRDREYSNLEFLENPNDATWVISGSPGAYLLQTRPTTAAAYNSITATGTGVNSYTGARQIGSSGVVRDKYCLDLGGFAGWSNTPSPVCRWQTSQFDSLVNDEDRFNLFGQFTVAMSEDIEFQTEMLYSRTALHEIWENPSDAPSAYFPTTYGFAATPAYFTPGTNPAVRQFMDDYGSYRPEQIGAMTNPAAPGRVLLPQYLWRLLGAGGNPVFGGEANARTSDYEVFRASSGVTIDIGDALWSTDVSSNVNLAYTYNTYWSTWNQILSDRLNAALNGWGSLAGANDQCDLSERTTANAGNTAAGCYWLNPFSSAIERNVVTGTANPGFVGSGTYAGYVPEQGLSNSTDLLRWLYQGQLIEYKQNYVVFDAVIGGKARLELPGGPIGWATGLQYRWLEDERQIPDLQDAEFNPCAMPGDRSCLDPLPGSRFARAPTGLFITPAFPNTDAKRRYPVASAFTELQLPIHQTLHAQVAARYEAFLSDRGGETIDVVVPTFAVKWKPLDFIAVRASVGKHFGYVEPPEPRIYYGNGRIDRIAEAREINTFTNPDLKSETGLNFNVGVIFDIGNFQATVDYWGTEIEGIPNTPTANQIVNDVFRGTTIAGPPPFPGGPASQIQVISGNNCSHPFLTQQQDDPSALIRLNEGVACNDDSMAGENTRASSIQSVWVSAYNAGTITTKGIDAHLSYLFDDVWGAQVRLSGGATWNLEYEVGGSKFRGVQINPTYDGLGITNEGQGQILGQRVQRWRSNASLNISKGPHNFNWLVTVQDGLTDGRINDVNGIFQTANTLNANTGSDCVGGLAAGVIPDGAGTGTTGPFYPNCNVTPIAGKHIEGVVYHDATYRVQLPAQTTLSLTVNNVLDKDPPFARQPFGYDAFNARPYGRTFKLLASKRF